MDKVRLGRTGERVSVAGLGCGGASRLGLAYGASVEAAAGVVRAALDLGVTMIDTARIYGTEEAVGLGLRGRRDEAFLCTKARVEGAPGAALETPERVLASLEESLRALGVEQVDLFYLHGVRPEHLDHCLTRIVPALQPAREAGKFRFLGITELFGVDSGHAMLPRALATGAFDVVMTGYNLINPSAGSRVFPLCEAHDVGGVIMFAVRRALSQPGALQEVIQALAAAGQVDAAALDRDDPLGFLTAEPGVGSLVSAAYRYCRHQGGANVVLTGTGSVEHLKANVAAILEPPLPAALLERLDRIFGRVDSVSGN